MVDFRTGMFFRGKRIKDVVRLSNGWYILKTENTKSPRDFKVRLVYSLKPLRSLTPKHAHFAIDLYGKYCASKEGALEVFRAIIEVWHGEPVEKVLDKYHNKVSGLPGYDLEYILYALRWILEQEDINFKGRPERKQKQLDETCRKCQVVVPEGRKGSQLAISLLCDIISGVHPVEAFLKANLDVQPRKRG